MDILFSCIGKTDPVKHYHDGAVLHILRNYPQISKVVLFMSKEIMDYHKKFDYYNIAFEDFMQKTERQLDIEYIDSGLEQVDDYDEFFDQFNKILKGLLHENPDSHIYLNISSGTPAMKATLLILAVENVNKKVTLIQVTDPKYVKEIKENGKFDILDQLTNNIDNTENSHRCKNPSMLMFFKNKIKNQLISLLNNYNYEGALTIYKENYDDKNVKLLIEHLRKRLLLEKDNERNVEKLNEYFNINCYPINNRRIEEIIEYFLLLQTMVNKKQVTEFLLRLNPFIKEIEILYLKEKHNLKIDNYIKKVNHRDDLDLDEFKRDYPEIYGYLDNKFNGINSNNISIQLLTYVIEFFEKENMNKLFVTLNEINSRYRNSAAHELFSVTDEEIMNNPNIKTHSRKLLKDIWELLRGLYGNHFPDNIINLYDHLNNVIIEHL
ncbi:MAG TPA: hypothetical protein GXZ48_06055 [Acholeplasmataceae bacterium]|nr:hypothetical protein [Acholeplasmataceae bacterium]